VKGFEEVSEWSLHFVLKRQKKKTHRSSFEQQPKELD
jgi:hypothetical protein